MGTRRAAAVNMSGDLVGVTGGTAAQYNDGEYIFPYVKQTDTDPIASPTGIADDDGDLSFETVYDETIQLTAGKHIRLTVWRAQVPNPAPTPSSIRVTLPAAPDSSSTGIMCVWNEDDSTPTLIQTVEVAETDQTGALDWTASNFVAFTGFTDPGDVHDYRTADSLGLWFWHQVGDGAVGAYATDPEWTAGVGPGLGIDDTDFSPSIDLHPLSTKYAVLGVLFEYGNALPLEGGPSDVEALRLWVQELPYQLHRAWAEGVDG